MMSAGSETHSFEPIEALLAHAGGQHGHAAAAENAGDGDAAAAVISGRRPDGAIMRRIEMSGHQTRHQTGIGGQHLVRPDHRKAPPEQNDDRRLHAGQRLRQHDMAGQRHAILAVGGVEPVHAPQIFRIRVVRADRFEARSHAGRDARRIGELAPGRQSHLRGAQALHRRAPALAIEDFRLDEEWCRHSAGAASSGCASAACAASKEAR